MKYWQGVMDWPLDSNWLCPICGNVPMMPLDSGLTWGLVNGQCRCNKCHAEFTMRIGKDILVTPKCMLKPEYIDPFKQIWHETKTPIDRIDDGIWDRYISLKAKS